MPIRSTMKLCAQLVMISVAGGVEQLDPGFNPDRPRLHPQPVSSFSSIAEILPKRIKFDPDLYASIDERYFGRGRFQVPKGRTGTVEDVTFTCGQNAMNLIVRTDTYAGLSVVNEADFTLLDPSCNSTTGYMKWEAVTDDNGDSVELLFVDIPLDGCGSTAEYDADTDQIIFSNNVQNGAYSINQNQASHNGVTLDSIVDFSAKCRYNAVYEEIDVQTSAETTKLNPLINDGTGKNFALDISFLKAQGQTTRSDGLPVLEAFDGNPVYTVGDPAYFSVGMTHPNNQLMLMVDSCTMVSGLDASMNYTIITDHCPDPFTQTKLIHKYEAGTSLVSFTMFEFVSDMDKTVNQDNRMVCKIKLCIENDYENCPVNQSC